MYEASPRFPRPFRQKQIPAVSKSSGVWLLLALLATMEDSHAESVTFGTGANEFTMEFSDIGAPFHVGTHEVSRDMVTKANAEGGLGIMMFDYEANGISGGNRPARPATGISWFEAATFVNWLNASQGFAPAYKFDSIGGTFALWEAGDPGFDVANPYRNSLAKYALPSLGEWHKAAFYNPSVDFYENYTAASSLRPTAVAGGVLDETAIYFQPFTTGPADIGDAGGLSSFGTMAQGGNVAEWVETASDLTNDSPSEERSYRGGAWDSPDGWLRKTHPGTDSVPESEDLTLGFRVAAVNLVPESPSFSITDLAFDRESQQVRLEWNSVEGCVYRVEKSTDLGRWNMEATLTAGVGTSTAFVDDGVAPPRCYYRVALLSQPLPDGMVLIPAGNFKMGRQSSDGFNTELPVHTVYISAFYLDQFEVTKGLWDEVASWGESHGYRFFGVVEGQGELHPVSTAVTWRSAVKWCNARSEMEGLTPVYYIDATLSTVYRGGAVMIYANWTADGYCLPTEAEWEKAARGALVGNTYPWGDSISGGDANFRNSGDPFDGLFPPSPETTPVGFFDGGQLPLGPDRANSYGLYDMAGNVWEWCWDGYREDWYEDPAAVAPDTRGQRGSGHVARGGSWSSNEPRLRCAARGSPDQFPVPPDELHSLGFRCARGLR